MYASRPQRLRQKQTSASPVANLNITPRLLSVKQASAFTGMTVWHLRSLYWAKSVAGFIAGRRLLIERESLDAYIDEQLRSRAQ